MLLDCQFLLKPWNLIKQTSPVIVCQLCTLSLEKKNSSALFLVNFIIKKKSKRKALRLTMKIGEGGEGKGGYLCFQLNCFQMTKGFRSYLSKVEALKINVYCHSASLFCFL